MQELDRGLANLPARHRGAVAWYPLEVSVVASVHGLPDSPVRDAVLREILPPPDRTSRHHDRPPLPPRADPHDGGAARLTVEIIPTSLHGKNPRTAMGKAMWERQRKQVCDAAGNRCEICGGVGKRHPVEIHERYEYDETTHPPCQKVLGLIALCSDCHAVKHLAREHGW